MPMLLTLAACRTLDDVPVVEGYHCAIDAYGFVTDVLDGDTLKVWLPDPNSGTYGDATIGEDTGSPVDTATDTGGSSASAESPDIVTIRLLGVDAPEIAHNDAEVADCWGNESWDFMSRALLHETVIVSRDATCQDIYGRELAYVLISGSPWENDCDDQGVCNLHWTLSGSPVVLMNDITIRYGYGKVYEDFDNIQRADLLYSAQDAAKAANDGKGRGIWSECE